MRKIKRILGDSDEKDEKDWAEKNEKESRRLGRERRKMIRIQGDWLA
jgi:hypothetical protein